MSSKLLCSATEKIKIDKITGDIVIGELGDVTVYNKDNNCKYFKKMFFRKKRNKIFCRDCKYYYLNNID